MSKKYIVSHNGEELGPFSEDELKAKVDKFEILPIDYLYDDQKQDWVLISERFAWVGIQTAKGKKSESEHFYPQPPNSLGAKGADEPPPASLVIKRTRTSTVQPTSSFSAQMSLQSTDDTARFDLDAASHGTLVLDDVDVPTQTEIRMTENTVLAKSPHQPTLNSQHANRLTLQRGVGELDLSHVDAGSLELQVNPKSPLKFKSPPKIVIKASKPKQISWDVPSAGVCGKPLTITVRALDEYGNLCTHFSHKMTLELRGHQPGFEDFEIEKGFAKVTFAYTVAESLTVALTDSHHSGIQLPAESRIHFKPGSATHLIVDGPTEFVAGQKFKVKVKAVDAYGNLAEDYQGTIELDVNNQKAS